MKKIVQIDITTKQEMPRLLREVPAAIRAGFDVTIIGIGENHFTKEYKFIGFKKANSRLLRIFGVSRRMVDEAIKEGAEIVQLHSPELLLYSQKLKKNGIKVIFDSHEFYSYQIRNKHYIPKYLRNFIAYIYDKIETYYCKRIDAVIYPCTIEGKNYFENKTSNSYKIENFSKKIEINNNTISNRIIYAGSLSYERGIEDLAEAIINTKAQLILCGSFYDDNFKNKILNKYPKDKVVYLGSLNRDELFSEYMKSIAGACILHSIGQYDKLDNMSTKVYEYMQCGIPVIMSNFRYYKQLNDQLNFGICVQPGSTKEISKAINYLIEHPEERKEKGRNGKKACETYFNWENEEKKLVNIYKGI